MKAIQAFKLAAGTMLVAASLHVYAQDAASAAAPTDSAKAQVQQSKQQYKSAKAANRALSRKVRAALAKDKDISVANITVRAKDGAVILEGTVPEQSQVDHATDVAKGVPGVTSVKNALTIRPVGT
ncbi:osmotically-inducible protein OsmY [Paraburkholderia bannensis]|uniref:Osmotically-inducible protein OsmY n=1 Tax=Paraburkholderia bannensis TaxID=765414 RepID=A0A7W9WRU9_9BURK|nr:MULTISPECIES: BON domain-containing protein [Paraburkholderia]MBB3258562.1 osmotically-inducible protein OsmY [Paraburkholderia sp. WP4_3_2]MBB6103575.1 osmotically-inducible protein OsmY [Paraburkholderia bannensis]